MNITHNTIIGRMGWHGTKVHAVRVYDGQPRTNTICQERNNSTWKNVVDLRDVEATKDNVTCENCLTHIKVKAL